jgi:hypothetical protein
MFPYNLELVVLFDLLLKKMINTALQMEMGKMWQIELPAPASKDPGGDTLPADLSLLPERGRQQN